MCNYLINVANPSVFYVCFDHFMRGRESGRIYHIYSQEPYFFRDIAQLIKAIDAHLDEVNYPQAAMVHRSFIDKKGNKTQERKVIMGRKNELIKEQRGGKATFVVHIRYRQHASWQGEVTWLEERQKVGFRSALELIKLIDSALDMPEDADQDMSDWNLRDQDTE